MKICPFSKKQCMREKCMLWQERMGTVKGEDALRRDCAFNFAVDILLEGAVNSYGTARAVEIFREDMKKQNDGMAAILTNNASGLLAGQQNRLGNDRS